jgi:hypothetical protein
MSLETLVLLIVVLGAIWWWLKRRSPPVEPSAEDALLRACRGDREQMNRLVVREADRAPGITRAEAIQRVLGAYRRDNQ